MGAPDDFPRAGRIPRALGPEPNDLSAADSLRVADDLPFAFRVGESVADLDPHGEKVELLSHELQRGFGGAGFGVIGSSSLAYLLQHMVPVVPKPVGRDDVLGVLERHRAGAHRSLQRVLHLVLGLGTDD